MKEILMKKYRWIVAPLFLLIVALACVSPDLERAPGLAETITQGESTPVARDDAVEAIQTYARDILGLDLPNLKAGGRSGEINLPVTTREGVDVAVDLAGTTYLGFWREGFATLSVGDSDVSGDWAADVRDGSLGAFLVRVDQPLPTDVGPALELVLATYPGLNGYEFVQFQNDEIEIEGFEFRAHQVDDVHLQSWDVTLTGTTITAGVTQGLQQGKSVVWVVVASGALSSPFDQ
jgi:hypothetical protein